MWELKAHDTGVDANTSVRVLALRELIAAAVAAANENRSYTGVEHEHGLAAMLVCVGSKPCSVRIGAVTKRPADLINLAAQYTDRRIDEEGIDWLYDIPLHNM